MSTTIDNKVVEMRFDNKQFESGVQTTLSTLEKLKQSLNLTGASKGFDEVRTAANRVDLSGLSNAADNVATRFSYMQMTIQHQLNRIVDSAVNAGKRIVSALTIDPIKTGFSEYETQINAVQTILANTKSKGTTIEDVNGALDELNTYADKTIYNFTEMTRNIGTFTAAGVELDTSVAAIKGIANLAAVSGSTSQQASTAMYQLSQALASGTVKLMDWNSVVNAGMGGQVFQDALKETARVHGIAIDDMITKEGSFRETLSNGWLSSEILLETLSKFTGDLSEAELKSMGYTEEQIKGILELGKTANDAATKVKTFTQLWDTLKEAAQSGWSQSWEIIVGDFEEAKVLLTEISEVLNKFIGDSADARNELLENWKVLGGRTAIIDALKNAFEGIVSIVKPISEAFREIFPPITAEQLVAFSKGLRDLTAKMKLSKTTSENLKRTFKGVFAVFDIVKQAVVAVFNAIKPLFGYVDNAGGGILKLTASWGDWLVSLDETIKYGNVFGKVFDKIIGVIKKVGTFLKQTFVVPGMEVFHSFLEKIQNGMSAIGIIADGTKSGITSVFDAISHSIRNSDFFGLFTAMWKGIAIVGSAITKIFQTIGSGLGDMIGNFNFDTFLGIINTLIHGGIGVGIVKLINSIKGAVDGLPEILDGVSGCFEQFQNRLKGDALIKISVAIGLLAASLFVLSTIHPDKLMGAIGAITVLFTELVIAMKIMNGLEGPKGLFKTSKTISMMIGISTAILILASALKKVAGLDVKEMAVAVGGIAALMGVMVVAMKLLSNSSGDTSIIKGAYQMILVSTAVLILAHALESIAYLSWEDMAKGLIGVVTMLGAIVLAIKMMTTSGLKGITSMVKGAGSMILVASALVIMSHALKNISDLSWGELAVGLAGMAGALVAIVAAMRLMPLASSLTSAAAIVLVSGAMIILSVAMKEVAKLSWSDIGKGLITFGGALAILAIGLNFMLAAQPGAFALLTAAGALMLIAIPMKELGKLSWDGVAKGLVTIGGAIAILAAGLNVMIAALPGAAALLVAAVALAVITPILAVLGNMEWETIAKGLAAIAASFVVIGAAGLILGPLVPSILGLSAALLLIGTSIVVASIGLAIGAAALTALAAGITALSAALAAGATAIVAGLSVIIVGIADLIPTILAKLGEGIVAFCRVIADSAGAISEAVITVILAIIDILAQCVPPLVDVCILLLDKLMTALIDYTPKLTEQLFTVILGIIDSLSQYVPDLIAAAIELLFNIIVGILEGIAQGVSTLVNSAVDILASLFQGIADAMKKVDTEAMTEGIEAIRLLADLVGDLAKVALLTPMAMVGVLGLGVVMTELAAVLATVGVISNLPGLKWLIGKGGEFLQLLGTAIGQFIGGIAGGFAEGFSSSLPQIGSDLAAFMYNIQPFLDGAALIDESVSDGIKHLVGAILAITGANVIESISSWITGGSSIAKFAEELPLLGQGLKGFSDAVAGIVPENIIAAADAAKALSEMTNTIPNEGGVVGWFTGENSIAKFGEDIVELGKGLKGFSDEVAGVVPENIVAAAEAARAITEMTASIPNEGGIIAWVTGENSVTRFADTLPILGAGLKGFSDAIAGVVPENIVAAATAAKALADMTATIPNEGGMASWFTGENSVSKFAGDIVTLGGGLKGFSDAVAGVVPENITAAAAAAKSLAEMTASIPNEGGMISWFTGESSVSKFSGEIPLLGYALKGFSDAVAGIVPENVMAAASAAKSLAEMSATIPNEGGMVAWFAGENSVSKFSAELPLLGYALKGFSDAVTGIVPENLTAAASAAKSLAEMTATLPNEGGIKAWFSGESGVAKFSGQLPLLGGALKGFSDSITGINAENLTAAAGAAKALAEMTAVIPTEGGIKAWFTGKTSISSFADKLPTLGEGLKGFSDSVAGIVPENVTAAANAAKSLGEMTSIIPKDTSKITKFGDNLVKFGDKLKSYFSNMSGISAESISASKKAIETVKEATTLQSGNITSTANAIKDIAKALKELAKVPKNCASEFSKAIKELGDNCVDTLLKAFSDAKTDFKDAGKDAIDSFAKGVEANEKKAKTACTNVISACTDAISKSSSKFKTAGKNLVLGFAEGISANSFKAEAKARAMAKAAAEAAEEALDINSPSKVGYGIGDFFGLGFINALSDNIDTSYAAGSNIAEAARKGLSAAASKIQSLINGDMDMQPTISPVIDLSGVKTGVNAISSMFGTGSSLGLSTNVGAISTMMNRRIQNGDSEIVSALKDLRKDIGNIQHASYTIDGITYDDGSNIASAVQEIVRAATMGRRV